MIYIAIDFETCGREKDSACSIGLVKILDQEIIDTYATLIKPHTSEVLFSDIHGLTWDDLEDQPPFPDIWEGTGEIRSLKEFCNNVDFFIAHNAPFDQGVLHACLQDIDPGYPISPFLCTLKGARKGFPDLRSRSLDKLCAYLSLPLNHHRADSDACACANIFLKLKEMGVEDEQMLVNGVDKNAKKSQKKSSSSFRNSLFNTHTKNMLQSLKHS